MMRRLWKVLLIAMIAATGAIGHASELVAQDTSLVVVDNDRIEITIIPPKYRVRPARAAQVGFYSWRVDFRTGDATSIVVASDTIMRSDNIREIIRGSALRRCTDGKDFSSQRCRSALTDSLSARGDALRIVIRDSALVALVRKVRPADMWGSTFEPNGRFRVDHLKVEYDDDELTPKSAPRDSANTAVRDSLRIRERHENFR